MDPNAIEELLFKAIEDPEAFNKTLVLAFELYNKQLTSFNLTAKNPKNQSTLLEVIVQHASEENIQTLLKIDKLKSKCLIQNGQPLLHIAAKNNKNKIVELLCKDFIKPNAVNNQGHTALTIAADLGFENIINGLLRYNANPNQTDKDENTPLLLAIEKKHIKSVETLLFFGAGIGQKLPRTFSALAVNTSYCCVLGMQIDGKIISVAEPGFEKALFDINDINNINKDNHFDEVLKYHGITLDDYKKHLRKRCIEVLDMCENENEKSTVITSFLKQLKFPSLVEMLEEIIIRYDLLPELKELLKNHEEKSKALNLPNTNQELERPIVDPTIAKLNLICKSIAQSPLLKTLERNKKINFLNNLVKNAQQLQKLLTESSKSQGIKVKLVILIYLFLLLGSDISFFTLLGIRKKYTESTGGGEKESRLAQDFEVGFKISLGFSAFFTSIILCWFAYILYRVGEVPDYITSPWTLRLTSQQHRLQWRNLVEEVYQMAKKFNLIDIKNFAIEHNQNYYHIGVMQDILTNLIDLLEKQSIAIKRDGPLWVKNSFYPRIDFARGEKVIDISPEKDKNPEDILEFNI